VVAGPVELEPETDWAGEGQQRLWVADPSSRLGEGVGAPHQRVCDSLTVAEVWSCAADECVVPCRIGRLTVGRNMKLDQFLPTRQQLRTQKVEALLRWCFVFGPPRIYASMDSKLPSRVRRRVRITSTVALRVVKGDGKGTQCLGENLATLFLGDINTGTWPPGCGSLESETVKYDH
jgi:hypothetical protein